MTPVHVDSRSFVSDMMFSAATAAAPAAAAAARRCRSWMVETAACAAMAASSRSKSIYRILVQWFLTVRRRTLPDLVEHTLHAYPRIYIYITYRGARSNSPIYPRVPQK